MSNEADWKVAADLEVESTIPREKIVAAVKGQGSKSAGPRAKACGKSTAKDTGPQQGKKPGEKPAGRVGPQDYKRGR